MKSFFSAPFLTAAAGTDSFHLDPRIPAGPGDWPEQLHELAPDAGLADKDDKGDHTGEEVEDVKKQSELEGLAASSGVRQTRGENFKDPGQAWKETFLQLLNIVQKVPMMRKILRTTRTWLAAVLPTLLFLTLLTSFQCLMRK